ncbi:shikimate dehydrogenase [Rhodospirillaceae bacterium KN72]|uniref:Shikimate dehydrogenase (NADP(+)) n=1 Tax=Pacificispira spongiicola TaxID=2729598 RepID=A0A7Y0E0S9_9PROT|nr:shikimate dehydrogenase [Pacificispira spongiicola]NMM45033.1 shikimate dehydrogenase [Pacificispira spongiicola]
MIPPSLGDIPATIPSLGPVGEPVAGVVGHPIGQSLSPVLHGTWLKRYGIKGRYEIRDLPPDNFALAATKLLDSEGWVGMNVTVPFKEAAHAYCDILDSAAKRLGAVNTIVKRKDGGIEGRNTDLYGFRANLEAADGWADTGRGVAVVLGAGGAARAVIGALQDLGFAEIRIVNRNQDRAKSVASDLQQFAASKLSVGTYKKLPKWLADADFLVNTTSLGMTGQPELDIDLSPLPKRAFVTDIVYKPLETGLLAQARARGNATVDGLGMLLHQAVPGFVAWFNPPEPPVVDDALRRAVLEAIGQ